MYVTIKDKNRMATIIEELKTKLLSSNIEEIAMTYWNKNNGGLFDSALHTFKTCIDYLNPNSEEIR